jgi:hypothetical protein
MELRKAAEALLGLNRFKIFLFLGFSLKFAFRVLKTEITSLNAILRIDADMRQKK